VHGPASWAKAGAPTIAIDIVANTKAATIFLFTSNLTPFLLSLVNTVYAGSWIAPSQKKVKKAGELLRGYRRAPGLVVMVAA
jgi:hypothetical protein